MAKTLASQAKDGGSIPLARFSREPPGRHGGKGVMRLRTLVATMVCWGLAAPAGALAVGGPVFPVQGGAGVTAPGLGERFVAVKQGRDTRIDRMSADGAVERTRRLHGRLGVPGVGVDGSTTGLSADGRTLVVAGHPAAHGTRIVVLDRDLRPRGADILLPGYYTVDAVSPDGRWMYLVHYLSPARDILRYEVRAYDVAARRMTPGPIVDPREPDEKMQGFAVTRAVSPDGRWAYTLYMGEETFVHALDTVGRTAACIDLEGLANQDITSADLRLDGPLLRVGDSATIDTRTFKVAYGPAASPPTPARAATPAHDGDHRALLWMLVIVPVAAAALGFQARRRRRVKRSAWPPAGAARS